MKKNILTLLMISASMLLFAGNGFKAKFNQPSSDKYEVSVELGEWSLKEITVSGQTFQKIVFDGSAVTEQKGWAALPFISASVQLPNNKNVDMEVIEGNYTDIKLSHPLLPSRGTIYRNQDPSKIAYEIAPESIINEFYPADLSVMESPFVVRDVRGTTVRVFPFRYNAATKTLRVYSDVKVILTENNKPATNPLLREDINPVRDAIGIYQSMFINYKQPKLSATLTSMDEYGDILVITTSDYMSTMDPYIQWKREKGYNVTTQTVSKGSNVATAIQTAYNNNPKLMYVQLAGDWADIKSPTYSSAPTDPSMGCVSGSDNYPDISIGRFSCSGTADLKVQIDKAINYEKNPDMTAGWRETFIGIGSAEGSGIGDDDEIDYDHIKNIYNNRLNPKMGYQTHQQNYGSNPSSSTLHGYINSGASTIAYCGHGDTQYWVTTGYDNTKVNSTTNGDKLPFIVSVACVNGEFHNSTKVCFAEAWLRKSGGGALVFWGSTINQPWTPPQRGQDYFYDILIGGYNYDNYSGQSGYNTSEQRTHWGCIAVNSFNLMLKESSYSDDLETVKTWTTFGDGAVQLRTKQPDNLVLSDESVLAGVPFAGTATVNGNPIANAQICLSQNGTYFSTLTDASGNYSINHTFTNDSVLLVATAFNTTTIYKNVFCSAPCDGATNLVCTTDTTMKVNLTWTAPANNDVLYYNVYCNGSVIATTTTTSYLHTGLNNDTYNYSVAVVYSDGECPVKASETVTVSDGSNHDCNGVSGLTAQQNGHDLVISWSAPAASSNIFEDVEGHTAFDINSPGTIGWSYIDGDGAQTYGISGYNQYTNESYPMAYMVFDPNQIYNTSNNLSLAQNENVVAHSGDKFFASFVSKSAPNDDYIITPALSFGNTFTFEFYARGGHKSQYVESFEVVYSTTGNSASNFTNVAGTVASVPFTWTKYSYTIPATAKYVAIHCTSNDAYYLCVDDISIQENVSSLISYYKVYCNNVPVGTTTSTSYTINNLPTGSYDYCVEAYYTDGCSSLPECSNATIQDVTYTITASANIGGTITPNGTTTVAEGANQSYSISANTNYVLTDVLVDNVSVGAVTSYTFTNVTANHTIYAQFEYQNSIDNNSQNSFSIYPNPVDNELYIRSEGTGYVEILNFVGQIIYKQQITEKNFKINTENISSGVYFIRMKNNSSEITKKFIKR